MAHAFYWLIDIIKLNSVVEQASTDDIKRNWNNGNRNKGKIWKAARVQIDLV